MTTITALADTGHRRTEDGDPDTRPYRTGPTRNARTGKVDPERWWCFTHEQWEPRPDAPTCRTCGDYVMPSHLSDSNFCLNGCTRAAVELLATVPPHPDDADLRVRIP